MFAHRDRETVAFSVTITGLDFHYWPFEIDFESFCGLSPNYTYLTCRKCERQHSLVAETTVKQCAFAFIMFDFRIGIPGFVYVGAIFSAINIRHNVTTPRAGILSDCGRLAEKMAL